MFENLMSDLVELSFMKTFLTEQTEFFCKKNLI